MTSIVTGILLTEYLTALIYRLEMYRLQFSWLIAVSDFSRVWLLVQFWPIPNFSLRTIIDRIHKHFCKLLQVTARPKYIIIPRGSIITQDLIRNMISLGRWCKHRQVWCKSLLWYSFAVRKTKAQVKQVWLEKMFEETHQHRLFILQREQEVGF